MGASPQLAVASKPRKRFRIGLRGLIGLVLLAGLALGWLVRQDRLAREQTARLAELRRMGISVNDHYPTPLCWLVMKVMATDSSTATDRLGKVIDRSWMFTPRGFNAGRLPDDRVAAVVEKIGHFGAVKEVRFDRAPMAGLRLFYIDRVPSERLGVPKEACTFTDHPAPPHR